MRTDRPYLGYRGFATVLRSCADNRAGYVRPDPPASGSPWHICATAWGPQIRRARYPRVQLRERPETAKERALEASSVVRGDPEGGVKSSRSALCEGDALVVRERRDEIGGGIEPDMSIDGVFGARE